MHPLDGAKVNSYKAIEENQLFLFLVIRLKIRQSCGFGILNWSQITSLVGIFFSRVDHKTHQAVCSLKEYKTNRKPRTPFTTMQILYLSFVERTRVKIWPQEAKQDKFQLDAGSRAILYSGFSCIAVPCSASQQGGSAGICRLYRSYKDKHSFPAAHVVIILVTLANIAW
uniref:Uncharacterized protein n=1 Tax=Oryzias latipes TaxID=8090 RepID=A0A3P9KBM3_ORYLA